jgi:hypothetical protein
MARKLKSADEKRKAALALNLCMVSISQIIDYKDINVLKQEYDAILNNINLQQIIKDEALLNVFRSLLDIITFYLNQETDKQHAEREYQNRLKNALFDSLPSIAIISGSDPYSAAIGVAMMLGTSYLNYRRSKAKSKVELDKKLWELQRSAIEQLNGLRRSMFETAWRLSETYNFPDEWRLTERQIQQYNEVLIDPDPHRQYDRMEAIDSIFAAFPPFWYFKSRAALETAQRYSEQGRNDLANAFRFKALADLDSFDRAHFPLMREDVIAAQASLDKFSLLDPLKNKAQMLSLLERAQKLAGGTFDILQLCTLNYIALREPKPAIKILRTLVNEGYNIIVNGRLLSRIYCELGQKDEYEFLCDRIGVGNVLPWAPTLIEAREMQLVNSRDRLTDMARDLLTRLFAARTQKLGKVMIDQFKVWDEAAGKPNIPWSSKLGNSASFGSWHSDIKVELNEAYNEILNDCQFRKFLKTDRAIWKQKIQELADLSKEAIDKLGSQVKFFKVSEEAILKEIKTMGVVAFENFLVKTPKSSVTTQYVTIGRKLYQSIRDCLETLFVASPQILTEAFSTIVDEIKSENEIDSVKLFIESKRLSIVISHDIVQQRG